MARQVVRIEGLRELEDALRELPTATGKAVLRRALNRAGAPIAADAALHAPRLTGGLQKSVVVGTKLSRRQRAQHKKESTVEVFVGPAPSAKSITQEFGAAQHGPHPYMRPAWEANKQGAADSIKQDITDELDKTVKRLARKAAKLAAQMKK